MGKFINLDLQNLMEEHVCCAIGDPKHRDGVDTKKAWLKEQLPKGHVFRKLDARGKVFIEYAPLETAWVPVEGERYLYIYCLWVAGSYKGQGYAGELMEYCREDAQKQGKSGICVISSKKKKPYTADKKFFQKYGFKTVDVIGDYELLALSYDGRMPRFTDSAHQMSIPSNDLTIYYGRQCPFISNCIMQIKTYCADQNIPLHLEMVDSVEKAKRVPCVFNNWAVFYHGVYVTNMLLNENALKKLLNNS